MAVSYIAHDLEWLEDTFKQWRALIDSFKPFEEKIEDRTQTEPNAKGVPTIKVIAKKEDTMRTINGILKELPAMLKAIGELRKEKKESEIETRGGSKMNRMMEQSLEKEGK